MDLTNMEGVEGDEMKDYRDDPDYLEAMSELIWAMDEGYEHQKARAIDDLITIRLALMMEAQADKIKAEMEKSQLGELSGIGRTES